MTTNFVTPSRRLFIGRSATTLSAGALALLGGHAALAATSPTNGKCDIAILNVAVGLEYEGINAGLAVGYNESAALKKSRLVWSDKTLDA